MRFGRTLAVVGGVALLLGDSSGARAPGETPRATDLLRAEKLATETEKRLQLPARRPPGWRRGGSGWDEPGRARAADRRDAVTIQVRPARGRKGGK
jgi:hypothetical protein